MVTQFSIELPSIPDDYAPPRPVGYAEYLRLEEELPGKYEYHAGLMYPRVYPQAATGRWRGAPSPTTN